VPLEREGALPAHGYLGNNIRKVTWLLSPGHPELPDFLKKLRATINAPAATPASSWPSCSRNGSHRSPRPRPASTGAGPAAFQELRAHPAVAGLLAEARRPELKGSERWGKR